MCSKHRVIEAVFFAKVVCGLRLLLSNCTILVVLKESLVNIYIRIQVES